MARKKKADSNQATLLDALKQVALAQQPEGSESETHCCFHEGFIAACNGILAAGVTVPETFIAWPHTHKLLNALERCEGAMTITQLEGKLSVRSGPFRALIPCLASGALMSAPDPKLGIATDALREALNVAGVPVTEHAPQVLHASILLRSGSALGTNGHVVIEAWHGLSFPGEFVLPKCFQKALNKIEKPIAAFGNSANSFTVYFEDGSWLRTQLYGLEWPSAPKTILDVPCNPEEVHSEFFKAAQTVSGFGTDHAVFFQDNYAGSRPMLEETAGAAYELKKAKLPSVQLDAELLAMIEPHTLSVDFKALAPRAMLFFGSAVRGCVAYRV